MTHILLNYSCNSIDFICATININTKVRMKTTFTVWHFKKHHITLRAIISFSLKIKQNYAWKYDHSKDFMLRVFTRIQQLIQKDSTNGNDNTGLLLSLIFRFQNIARYKFLINPKHCLRVTHRYMRAELTVLMLKWHGAHTTKPEGKKTLEWLFKKQKEEGEKSPSVL